MSIYQPFSPAGATVSITAGAASASVALTNTGEGGATREIRIHNSGVNIVFLDFGNAAVAAAAATGMPVAPGATEKISLAAGCTHVAAIAPTGTPVVYFTSGRGL